MGENEAARDVKWRVYRLEELLVHDERPTTSGVGTGEDRYLLAILPAP